MHSVYNVFIMDPEGANHFSLRQWIVSHTDSMQFYYLKAVGAIPDRIFVCVSACAREQCIFAASANGGGGGYHRRAATASAGDGVADRRCITHDARQTQSKCNELSTGALGWQIRNSVCVARVEFCGCLNMNVFVGLNSIVVVLVHRHMF